MTFPSYDDQRCKDLLDSVGLAACPSDAHFTIKKINAIKILKKRGGNGAFREFVPFRNRVRF